MKQVFSDPWRRYPLLQTDRLELRRFRHADIHKVYEGLSNPSVTRYYAAHFDTLEETEEQMEWFESLWRERSGMWWAICRQGEKQLIGACGFTHYKPHTASLDIGYWLLPAQQGKGFAREALEALLLFCFEQLQARRIEAWVEQGNKPSERLLRHLGFKKEKTLRKCEEKNERLITVQVFVLMC